MGERDFAGFEYMVHFERIAYISVTAGTYPASE